MVQTCWSIHTSDRGQGPDRHAQRDVAYSGSGAGTGRHRRSSAVTGRLWPGGPADAVGGRDRPSPCPAQRYSRIAVHTGSGMAPDRTSSGGGSGSASTAARVATMYHLAVSVFRCPCARADGPFIACRGPVRVCRGPLRACRRPVCAYRGPGCACRRPVRACRGS